MELFDAVYPLGTGSLIGNAEIRFSLRSLKQNTIRLGKVYVVGEKPKFLNWSDDLVHVPFTETHRAYRNTWEKVRYIAMDERVTERFVWMNDDFYIVKQIDAGEIPNFVRGGSIGYMNTTGGKLGKIKLADIKKDYHRTLKNTLTALTERGMTAHSFCTHQPVNFEKTKVLECYEEFKNDLRHPSGLSFRCCYGNMFKLERTVRPTQIVKRNFKVPRGPVAFASHRDVDLGMLVKNLTAMFPEKSVFEVRH